MALTNDDMKAIANLFKPIQDDIQMIKEEIHTLKKDTTELKGDIQILKQDVQILKHETQELKQDVQDLKNRVTSIEITLENETNRGIKVIAEGHLNLDRKLSEASKVENEKELLLLRVSHLENEMRKVKDRLNQIA
jgi:archaellum component FlaC